MKWIIILATVLSCATQTVLADQDMPLGDSNPELKSSITLENVPDIPVAAEAPAPSRQRSKPKTMPKGSDYQPAQDLLLSAMSLIGVKYTWGGNTPESGLDCSGFIKYVFQNSMNITLPRTAFEMAHTGQSIDKSELKPGDLVFFNTLGRTFSHVGIYLGDNRFIHSPRAGRNVEVANMNINYWQSRFNGARRIADGGSQGLNVNSLLAASSRPKADSSARSVATENRSNRQCKKVVTGKGKNKKTVIQCARVGASETGKSSVSSRKKASAKEARGSKVSSKKSSTAARKAKQPVKKKTQRS
ncbi:C40 family peptidase [Chitinibacter sp. GC72]|uniref:C40 family peptidase n=1 Tax=Chitinibacter sp. GC72 TaxID=1526917 RepID=UPI0012FAFE30|nr:C40 family peptidase [Chitinibacter sp. GC72]